MRTHPRTRQSRRRPNLYRTVADFTYDLEIWINPDGSPRYVSPSCLRVTGYNPRMALSASDFLAGLIHPEDLSRWRTAMDKARHADIGSMDFRVRRHDGGEIWLAQETTRVFDDKGVFHGLRLSLRDVTDRVRTQASLDQARQHLEDRVRERTAELEESRERYRALSSYLQDSIEKERTRISREIHDVLGQDLTALNMGLHRLERSLSQNDPRRAQTMELRGLVAVTLSTVRRISRELRPPMLDELGFAEAVAWRARTFAEATGLTVDCRTGHLPQLAPGQATALYRVLQECLTNAARHSGATRLTVRVAASKGRITLRVTDNGRGIQLEEAESAASLGIIGMRERVRLIGGRLDISRPSSGGTAIIVQAPIFPATIDLPKEHPCDF